VRRSCDRWPVAAGERCARAAGTRRNGTGDRCARAVAAGLTGSRAGGMLAVVGPGWSGTGAWTSYAHALAYDACMLRLAEGVSQKEGSSVAIVSDRGVLDGAAFLSIRDWEQVRTRFAVAATHGDVHVVHLESVACRFPSIYLRERDFRAEDPARAAHLDRKLIDVWRGCASWRSVRSYASFSTKLEKSLQVVGALLDSLLLGAADKVPPPSP
jgi:hypothetical protein